jgi:uncharacterized protein YwgA/O-acetyl-ADP-ribose deacetylase (regulator of RNase III)
MMGGDIMPKIVVGNLFDSDAQTLVNTVNCVGVMGKGIALEFKRRFPDYYRDYVEKCDHHRMQLGHPDLYRSDVHQWIVSFPTKGHWRSATRLSDIQEGLDVLVARYRDWGITSLAVPPLGCGQGQLEWRVVGPTIYRALSKLSVPVILYAPPGTPPSELQPAFLDGTTPSVNQGNYSEKVRPAWVALVEVVKRIEQRKYHHPVGHTTFQKIAYVATECGLPTGLTFTKGTYGPYSAETKGLMTKLVNNGIIHEVPKGKFHAIKPGPTFEDARSEYSLELSGWERELDLLTDLFIRVDSSEAELIATVMFVAKRLAEMENGPVEPKYVVSAVNAWKNTQSVRIRPKDVEYALEFLASRGLADVARNAASDPLRLA